MQTERTDAGILARYFGIEILAYPIAFVWAAISIYVMYRAMRGLIQTRNGAVASSDQTAEYYPQD